MCVVKPEVVTLDCEDLLLLPVGCGLEPPENVRYIWYVPIWPPQTTDDSEEVEELRAACRQAEQGIEAVRGLSPNEMDSWGRMRLVQTQNTIKQALKTWAG